MILVDVYIPAVDSTYDFMLDENMAVEKIILEISEMIAKKMKSKDIKKENGFLLCSMDDKHILESEKTLYGCAVRDGSRLILL